MKKPAQPTLLARLAKTKVTPRPEGWKTVFEIISEDGGKVSVTTARKLLREGVKAGAI